MFCHQNISTFSISFLKALMIFSGHGGITLRGERGRRRRGWRITQLAAIAASASASAPFVTGAWCQM